MWSIGAFILGAVIWYGVGRKPPSGATSPKANGEMITPSEDLADA